MLIISIPTEVTEVLVWKELLHLLPVWYQRTIVLSSSWYWMSWEYRCLFGSPWGCCSHASPVPLGSGDKRHSQEATSQSYQCSQIRHFFTKKGIVLHHWHCLLGHSIKHIESWLVFFLREKKRRKLRNKHRLGVGTREKYFGGWLWVPLTSMTWVLRMKAKAT